MMVVAQSEAIAERPDLNFGVVVGGDGGIASALEKTEGGKAPAAYLRGSFSRTTTLRPRTTTAMRTTAPRSRQGARPARQVPRTVSIRSGGGRAFAAATPKRQAPVWPSGGEVATMRGRNKTRFSAPQREPPGGRASRGAKLKGRGDPR